MLNYNLETTTMLKLLTTTAAAALVCASTASANVATPPRLDDTVDTFALMGVYAPVCMKDEINHSGWQVLVNMASTYPQDELKAWGANWYEGVKKLGPDRFCAIIELTQPRIPIVLRDATREEDTPQPIPRQQPTAPAAPSAPTTPTEKTEEFVRQHKPVDPPPPPPKEITDQAERPVAPPTLPLPQLPPLSQRLAEINNLTRQSLPIITRHCGKDAACRQQQTAAMQELAGKEIAIAKALRDPTSYGDAIRENDTVNACKVMWRASEDFVGLVRCINDATPPVAEAKLH
jgi:outer membrane biosynthesis protein TonB